MRRKEGVSPGATSKAVAIPDLERNIPDGYLAVSIMCALHPAQFLVQFLQREFRHWEVGEILQRWQVRSCCHMLRGWVGAGGCESLVKSSID